MDIRSNIRSVIILGGIGTDPIATPRIIAVISITNNSNDDAIGEFNMLYLG